MDYSKYNRSFIMLEDQKSGFSSKNGEVKGYLKIETGNDTGVFKCTLQNIKYHSNGEYVYKLLLFGKKEKNTIFSTIGTISVDKLGNGDYYSRFDPYNVDGEGHSLHDFLTATIVAASTKDENETLHLVLKGALEKSAESAAQKPSAASAQVSEASIKSDHEEIAVNAAKNEPKEIKISEQPKNHTLSYQRMTHDFSDYLCHYIITSCNHMEKLVNFYEEVTPFSEDKIKGKWWKVLNLMSLPFVNTTYNLWGGDHLQPYKMNTAVPTSPSCFDLAYKYRHFLFGIKKDENGKVQKYYYAVPGKYADEHPDDGKTGFNFWQPLVGVEKQSGAYGYWIISVDPYAREIEQIVGKD